MHLARALIVRLLLVLGAMTALFYLVLTPALADTTYPTLPTTLSAFTPRAGRACRRSCPSLASTPELKRNCGISTAWAIAPIRWRPGASEELELR